MLSQDRNDVNIAPARINPNMDLCMLFVIEDMIREFFILEGMIREFFIL